MKSTKARVTCTKHIKDYKSLYTFHGIRSVDSGKACGMQLMANPSREITTVAYEVPKEGHAIWSKELHDFRETAPGMLLSPNRNRALHHEIWRYQTLKKSIIIWVLSASPNHNVGQIQPKPLARWMYIWAGPEDMSKLHKTAAQKPTVTQQDFTSTHFSIPADMVTCAEGEFSVISWKGKSQSWSTYGLAQFVGKNWKWVTTPLSRVALKIVKRKKLSNRQSYEVHT